MDVGLTFQVQKFNDAMRDMEKRLEGAVTLKQIIDFEVGKILQATMVRTRTATEQSIRKTADIPWRKWDLGRGVKTYYLLNHYPDPLWQTMQNKLAASFQRKLAARSLAKRSWLELGIRIQQKMTAPGQVARAVSPGGHTGAENVNALRSSNAKGYELTIENRSPLIHWSNASQAFYAAVAGRRKYFEKNLALGVFKDLAQVAKRYPGLIVSVPVAA